MGKNGTFPGTLAHEGLNSEFSFFLTGLLHQAKKV